MIKYKSYLGTKKAYQMAKELMRSYKGQRIQFCDGMMGTVTNYRLEWTPEGVEILLVVSLDETDEVYLYTSEEIDTLLAIMYEVDIYQSPD